LLSGLRENGDWEEWLLFFLEGVTQTAERAASTARQLLDLFDEDASRIQQQGRTASSALRVHRALQERPIISLREVGDRAGLASTATTTGMRVLETLGIAREITGRERDRRYAYQQYIDILSEGTEPL
jgi:Fic family protein